MTRVQRGYSTSQFCFCYVLFFFSSLLCYFSMTDPNSNMVSPETPWVSQSSSFIFFLLLTPHFFPFISLLLHFSMTDPNSNMVSPETPWVSQSSSVVFVYFWPLIFSLHFASALLLNHWPKQWHGKSRDALGQDKDHRQCTPGELGGSIPTEV